jgi:hypothetical protein
MPDQPKMTLLPVTMSAEFGEEWKRRDDWGPIGSITVPNLRPGDKVTIIYYARPGLYPRSYICRVGYA